MFQMEEIASAESIECGKCRACVTSDEQLAAAKVMKVGSLFLQAIHFKIADFNEQNKSHGL